LEGENMKTFFKKFAVIISSVIVGFLGGILFFELIMFDRMDYFRNKYILDLPVSGTNLKNAINQLVASGKLIPIHEILNQTISYYDTIITILVAMLGAVVALAFISIRMTSSDEIKEAVAEELIIKFDERKFIESTHSSIRDIIQRDLGQDLSSFAEKVNILEEKVSYIDDKKSLPKKSKNKIKKKGR
jgi:uncharacterized membrane protein YgaE (UPF0421/DUF939 family)